MKKSVSKLRTFVFSVVVFASVLTGITLMSSTKWAGPTFVSVIAFLGLWAFIHQSVNDWYDDDDEEEEHYV